MSLRRCVTCPKLVPQRARNGRCTDCQREQEQARGTAAQRGYDQEHKAERIRWSPLVEAGTVHCRRGPHCLEPSTLIAPGTPWDLGHPDDQCPAPRAPEHRRCNRATAARYTQGRDPQSEPSDTAEEGARGLGDRKTSTAHGPGEA